MSNLYIKEIRLMRDNIDNFGAYPFSLPIIKNMNSIELSSPVTFIMGDNGSGKSTLIEAVAGAWGLNPEGGTKNFSFATKETHSMLYEHIRLTKGVKRPSDSFFLRAESFYNVASEYDRLYEEETEIGAKTPFGSRSLHMQSHGESFISLMKNRLSGNGLYIFDEPEAALSASGQLGMLRIMKDLVDKNSQLIIATHSAILSAFPGAVIYEANDTEFVKRAYEETDNYMVTKYFLNNKERIFKELFE
ncbi:MAG: AAA family ATPase [Clostridia bacterium]|nr:AAA family ATPase [Clostridia bacterium]